MFGADGDLGSVTVVATVNRGMSADEWVEIATNKIISVAADAPMPIREQALAYQDQIRTVLRFHFTKVARSERVTVAAVLRKEGFAQLADKIEDL